jgi:hypothetical protein
MSTKLVIAPSGARGAHRGRLLVMAQGLVLLALLGVMLVVVSGASAEGGCPNERLRTENHSSTLPDCRAYELVTPAYTEGTSAGLIGMSEAGNSILLESIGVFAGAKGSGELEGIVYQSSRTGSGWLTSALNPPASSYPFAQFEDATPNLSRTLWVGHTTGQSLDESNLYIREPGGEFVLVGPEVPAKDYSAPSSFYKSEVEVHYAGASRDLSHILFFIRNEAGEESKTWTGDATIAEAQSLYEYANTGSSEPLLVGVQNEGQLKSNSEAKQISQCGVGLGGNDFTTAEGAISESGNTIFITAKAGGCTSSNNEIGTGPTVNELYARVDDAYTVPLSEPSLSVPGRECTGSCKESQDEENGHSRSAGEFQGASPDGKMVFFITDQSLVNSDEHGDGSDPDLYEAELDQEGSHPVVSKLIQVSHDRTEGEAADVLGVMRVSGSHVYFVAAGVLTSEPNRYGQQAVAEADNLYVYDPHTARTRYVATLSSEDAQDWQRSNQRPVQLSQGGNYLVFPSRAYLTPGDHSGAGVPQLFEYDALTEELARVSIGEAGEEGYFCAATDTVETGYDCDGNSENSEDAPTINTPRLEEQDYANEFFVSNVASDGTVVFASRDRLSPYAVNAVTQGCVDAYEYSFGGGPLVDGDVHLVSNGQELAGSGATCEASEGRIDPSGSNLFVTSTEPLVPGISDTQDKLYDAREDGGFEALQSPVPCTGESCLGAPTAPPSFGAPASAGGSSQGNLIPAAPAPPVKVKAKSLTRSQKLAKALKACRSKRAKRKRVGCEKIARKRYGKGK